MLQNIIKNQKDKSFTLKIVFGSEEEAVNLENKLNGEISYRQCDIEKMRIAFGMKEIKVYGVFNSVFVQYEFLTSKNAKSFEISINQSLKEDNSNIEEAFILAKPQTSQKEESPYRIFLKLPTESKIVLEHKAIKSIKIYGVDACDITRELAMCDKKEVELVDEDASSEYLNIIINFNGKQKILVPQKWLDIEEKTIKAIVSTKWMVDLKHLVRIEGGNVISQLGDKEILASLETIKTDGQEIKLLYKNGKYINAKNNKFYYEKEMLIFKH